MASQLLQRWPRHQFKTLVGARETGFAARHFADKMVCNKLFKRFQNLGLLVM